MLAQRNAAFPKRRDVDLRDGGEEGLGFRRHLLSGGGGALLAENFFLGALQLQLHSFQLLDQLLFRRHRGLAGRVGKILQKNQSTTPTRKDLELWNALKY